MNSYKLLLTIVATAVLCINSVSASEIYRYTDEDGNVVYLDRPTGDPGVERLDIISQPTDKAAIQANVQARREAAATAALEKEEAGVTQMTRSEKRAAAAAKEQECNNYRAQLSSLSDARRLYRTDENGERVYLDGAQRDEALNKIQEQINENCN